MRTPIDKQTKARPELDLRGSLSRSLRMMGPTQRVLFLNQNVKWPHQTVHYHNRKAEKNGEPYRWTASRDLVGRWYIRRCDDEAIRAQTAAQSAGEFPPHDTRQGGIQIEDQP